MNMAPRKMLTKPVAAALRKDMTEAITANTFALNEGQTIDDVIEYVRAGIKDGTYKPGVTFTELLVAWGGAEQQAETSPGGDVEAIAQEELATEKAEDVEPIDDLASWLELYKQAKAKIEKTKEMADLAKAKITERLGDKTQATVEGQVVATWNWVNTSYFDKKKLTAEHPDLVEQYTRPNPSRRFELK